MSTSALRQAIFVSFAATGSPGDPEDDAGLRELAERDVGVGDDDGRVLMGHPVGAHRSGARGESGDRVWWGNCAWDGFGIVHALGLRSATVTAQGVSVRVADGAVSGDAVFHVLVPARHWWDDIAYT
jgi:hypothetical protein